MRLHRFFTDQRLSESPKIVISNPKTINQIKNVFRFKTGSELILFNGDGCDYKCKITNFDRDFLDLEIVSKTTNLISKRKVVLLQSIIKKDNFEWVVEKTTELGVTDIYPIISERSEKKSLNIDRLHKIATEASEQSGRGDVPNIFEILSLNDSLALNLIKQCNTIILDPSGKRYNKTDLSDFESSDVAIFIGPEGGWSDRELEIFKKQGLNIVSVGERILRAETATIAILASISA
jgi:16S rRNA (uracil1498-N3)-methyltransferase